MMHNNRVKTKIYGRVTATTPGAVFTLGDFADFGSRAGVSKALQRLATAGKLRRIDRGIYDRVRVNRLTGKPVAPDYRAVIDAIARRDQCSMLIDGMTAANDLGLSDAVPGRVVVHTDARLKPLRIGNLTVTFKLTSPSKLYWAGRPAMRLVQALHWLKPKLSDPSAAVAYRRRVKSILVGAREKTAVARDLAKGLPFLPIWIQSFVREVMPEDVLASPRRHRSAKRRRPAAP